MKFSELEETLIITERKINDINIIKSRMESHLNALKARITITDNVIEFKTIQIIMATGYINTNPILLRFYKEGKIVIEKQRRSLKIKWTVKLDTLYNIALFSSIFVVLIFRLYSESKIVVPIISGLSFFLFFVFAGILYIKYCMNDLIYSSVYPNYF